MDADKALERCRQLILLAASDFEEEARTAAFLACKLIRDNNFSVNPLRAPSPPPPPFPAPPPYAPYTPPAPWPSRSWDDPPPPAPPKMKRYRINAKFDSSCRECSAFISMGEVCYFAKGHGVLCPICYDPNDLR